MKRMRLKTSIVCAVSLTGLACHAAGLMSGSYVQDGLVVQLDAIDNTGTGAHNPPVYNRFSFGGEALANWTVTLNGQARTEQPVAGSMVVSVVKDATGLWLKVARSGVTIIFR